MTRALVLAALTAATGAVPSAAPQTIALPAAHVPCGTFARFAVRPGEHVTTEVIGRLYARALDAEGVGAGTPVTVATMATALSDVLGCFGAAPK